MSVGAHIARLCVQKTLPYCLWKNYEKYGSFSKHNFFYLFSKGHKNENYDESTKIYVVLVLDPLIGKIHNKFW